MFKTLTIYNAKPEYIIYDNGDLYDLVKDKFVEKFIDHKGYIRYSVRTYDGGKAILAHRLVLGTFQPIEGWEDLQVNHTDCNKQNNDVSNLEWCTNTENIRHAFAHGLIDRKGERNSQCKLTETEVLEIADLLMEGIPIKKIADMYNVSKGTISFIRNKRKWGWLLVDYNFPKSKYSNHVQRKQQ